jgi:hypothetical protein
VPLRHRIKSNPETMQDLELASEEKYWEAIELLVSGYRGAGIYLLGYVAEMILKRACFALDGARPFDLVGPRLAPVRSWAKRQFPGVQAESYHSLWFWTTALREKRRLAGKPLAPALEATLIQRARRIFGIWVVDMRYQPDQSLQTEARSAYDDVTWLRDHRRLLGV